MREECAADSPQNPLSSLEVLLLGLLKSSLGALCIYDFMIAREYVATSDVLKHSTCLEKKAAVGNLYGHLPHLAKPHK
jgi:hypothetical protein